MKKITGPTIPLRPSLFSVPHKDQQLLAVNPKSNQRRLDAHASPQRKGNAGLLLRSLSLVVSPAIKSPTAYFV